MSVAQANAVIKEWRENPRKFVWDNFKVEPDQWQGEALDIFPSQDPDKIRMSLQACVGPGKSALLAWTGWNFLSCYGERGEYPKGAAVSVTWPNLMDNLWPEYAKWRERSDYLKAQFEWRKERIFNKRKPDQWFMSARSWAKTASPEEQGRTLSGLHSKFILVQIDESGDIPISVSKAAEQALVNGQWRKIMQAGNPTSLEGMLHEASTSGKWYIIRVTGDPDDPKRSPRISLEWAQEQIEKWGRDDPWVMSQILGLFPPASINALVSADEVETAMHRHLREDQYIYSQRRLGVDCAKFGGDPYMLAPRQGLAVFKLVEMRNVDGPQVAARVALARERWNWEVCFVDDTGGYGMSVGDSLNQASIPHLPIAFSGKADDPRFLNKRAEMYLRFAKAIKKGLALPRDPTLKRELCAITYTFRQGKFMLEPKERIKDKLKGQSTNRGDAIALTYAHAEAPTALPYGVPVMAGVAGSPMPVSSQGLGHHSDWDPFHDDIQVLGEER